MALLQSEWSTITLRVDVHNMVGPKDAGKLKKGVLRSRLAKANLVWSQCGIQFKPHVVNNVVAADLNVPYVPASQTDLSKIAAALNPNGFHDAIPLTFAGPWNFYDAGTGVYLIGLGWAFMKNPTTIDHIGAMVDATRIFLPQSGLIIAHELGHTLSLPDGGGHDTLMGAGGTQNLTLNQCTQARGFAESALTGFVVRPAKSEKKQLAMAGGLER